MNSFKSPPVRSLIIGRNRGLSSRDSRCGRNNSTRIWNRILRRRLTEFPRYIRLRYTTTDLFGHARGTYAKHLEWGIRLYKKVCKMRGTKPDISEFTQVHREWLFRKQIENAKTVTLYTDVQPITADDLVGFEPFKSDHRLLI